MRTKYLILAASFCLLAASRADAGKADDLIDSVIEKIDEVKAKIDALENRVEDVEDLVDEAKTTAEGARDRAEEIVGRIRDGVATLNDTMRDLVSEAVDDARALIDRELAGRDAFLNDGTGQAFRNDLITLLREVDTLHDNLAKLVPGAPQVSFDDEIDFLEDAQIPLRLLWPLYRVVSVVQDDFPQGLIDQLKETNEALGVVEAMFVAPEEARGRRGSTTSLRALNAGKPAPGARLAVLGKPSSWVDYAWGEVPAIVKNQPELVEEAGKVIRVHSWALKAISAVMKSQSKTSGIIRVKKLQLHGYAGFSIDFDPAGAWAERLGGAAEILGKIADHVEKTLDEARTYGALREIRNNQRKMMEKLGVQ